MAPREPSRFPRAVVRAADRLHGLHTGHVGDYLAWLTLGAGVLGLVGLLSISG